MRGNRLIYRPLTVSLAKHPAADCTRAALRSRLYMVLLPSRALARSFLARRLPKARQPLSWLVSSSKKILVTGGTGYIGSHACVELINNGFEPIVLDNLSNSHPVVLDRIARISKHRPAFYKADIRDRDALGRVFQEHSIAAVIHFAGLKSVRESVERPREYYANNVEGSQALLDAMQSAAIKCIIFSSSATVYGNADTVPIPETASLRPVNPYGESKIAVEKMLHAFHESDPSWHIGILRYFNPVGAHESGLIGEDPKGTPENLMPFIAQVATGRQAQLRIFGDDYPTPDGTGIRDYIHVMDLADGHVAALNHLEKSPDLFTVNLGTGTGYSVLQMVKAFEAASGRSVPYKVVGRRPGDIASCYADVSKSCQLLGWRAHRGLNEMCDDVWRWHTNMFAHQEGDTN